MVRCWTCSTKQEVTTGDVYVCESCEDISAQIRYLEKTERDKISKIDDLIYIQRKGFDLLAGGMYEIASTIEWGFGEISWQLQQQTDILQEITAILKTPSETKANEWRQMGETHRRRGDYNEAFKFFLKSLDANSLDYRTYIGLGEGYLRIRKFNEAKKYFTKSLPHAPNDFYKSYSLRLIGRIYYCNEDYDHAIRSLKVAVELSPNYVEACYDLAQYYGVKGDARNALHFLIRVIPKDSFYFYLSEKERNFDPIRRKVLTLQEVIKERAYKDAELEISKAKNTLEHAEEFWDHFYELKEDRPIRSKLNLAMDKASSGDYESILEANSIAKEVHDVAKVAKGKASEAKKLLKDKQRDWEKERKNIIISIPFHISFLFCFVYGFIGGVNIGGWDGFGFLLSFHIMGAILEGIGVGINTRDSDLAFFAFIFPPILFLTAIADSLIRRKRMDERTEDDLDRIADWISGFW